ncbi:MAG: hypothetical protein PHR26_04070 [Candidatus ainarchaeum sp.]|nr:hypothetical protein [Candidatus ainarchaeum sp.]MDD3976032.1 hypothetical protein [Candidatus ainarchaeum sp.]
MNNNFNFVDVFRKPFVNYKFFLLILIFGILSLINSTFFVISFFLTIFISYFVISLNIKNKLSFKNLFSINLLKYSFIFIVCNFIFFIFQSILILIGFSPSLIVSNMFNFSSLNLFNLTISGIFGLIFIFFVIVLEFIKIINLSNYVSKEKIEIIFDFKKTFKLIFSRIFLVYFSFFIGYIFLILFIYFIILGLFTIFGNIFISEIVSKIFIMYFIYFLISGTIIIFNKCISF